MAFKPTYATVHNEGCDIRYWSQGTGPLIIFIPPGGGAGAVYNNIIAYLAGTGSFTAATFDRRQNSASQVAENKLLSPRQQAADALAVVRALGFDGAVVFGCSLGGVVALQFALDHPAAVEHVVAHEAPTLTLLPDAAERYDAILRVHSAARASGPAAAMALFAGDFVGMDDPGLPRSYQPPPANWAQFLEFEFLVASTYVPNLWRLRRSGVSVGVLRGERSKDAFYARAAAAQQEILECPLAVVPGNHTAYDNETDRFAPALVDFLRLLDERKKSKAAA